VDVRLSTYADSADVLAEEPGAVIVATGSLPRKDGVQAHAPAFPARGVEQPHVYSSHEIFDVPHEKLGHSALVLDDVGHYEAIAVAEYLIESGLKVTFVTRLSSMTPAMDVAMRMEPAMHRLRKGDFTVIVRSRLIEIGRSDCEIGYLEGEQTQRVPADTVVLVTHNESLIGLYRELGGGQRTDHGFTLKVAGDAHSPRDLLVAIREGHMAGRFLDS